MFLFRRSLVLREYFQASRPGEDNDLNGMHKRALLVKKCSDRHESLCASLTESTGSSTTLPSRVIFRSAPLNFSRRT
jgi:hypothetical protein